MTSISRSGRRRAGSAAALCAIALTGALIALVAAGAPLAALASAATTTTPASQLPDGTSPFSPGVPITPTTTPTTTTAAPVTQSTTTGGGGISGTDAILIGVSAILLIAVVSFLIWRDARRHVRKPKSTFDLIDRGRSGSKAPPKSRKLSAAERKRRKRGRAR